MGHRTGTTLCSPSVTPHNDHHPHFTEEKSEAQSLSKFLKVRERASKRQNKNLKGESKFQPSYYTACRTALTQRTNVGKTKSQTNGSDILFNFNFEFLNVCFFILAALRALVIASLSSCNSWPCHCSFLVLWLQEQKGVNVLHDLCTSQEDSVHGFRLERG